MKRILILMIIGLTLAVSSTKVQAQKFGYLNSAALLSEMTQVKEADANLDALQKQLQKKGQQMVEALQAKYQELSRKEKDGELAPKAVQDEATKLKAEEEKIQAFEQDMQKQIADKREQLLSPILDRVNKAIADVSKEKGYTFVFDASSQVLLYAEPGLDLMADVKVKLGMP